MSVRFYFSLENNFRWRQTIIRKMPKAFYVIVPAGKGDGARGEEGNAAFAWNGNTFSDTFLKVSV